MPCFLFPGAFNSVGRSDLLCETMMITRSYHGAIVDVLRVLIALLVLSNSLGLRAHAFCQLRDSEIESLCPSYHSIIDFIHIITQNNPSRTNYIFLMFWKLKAYFPFFTSHTHTHTHNSRQFEGMPDHVATTKGIVRTAHYNYMISATSNSDYRGFVSLSKKKQGKPKSKLVAVNRYQLFFGWYRQGDVDDGPLHTGRYFPFPCRHRN